MASRCPVLPPVRQCPDALWRQRQGPGVELPDAWWLMSGGVGLQCGSIGVDGWLAIGEEARAASRQRIGRSSLFFFIGTDPTGGEGKSKTIPVCTKIPSLKINGSKYLGVEELLVPLKNRNKPL